VGYIAVQDVYDAGVSTGIPEGNVQDSIDLWSAFIDRVTRQWFEPRQKVLLLDGSGSDTLFLPVPIIALTAIYLNGDFRTPVNLDELTVYDGSSDEARRNPKIRLSSAPYYRDIFLPLQRRMGVGFARGDRNQRIEGTFGYVEADGTTPLLIKRAVLRLVAANVGSFKQSLTAGGGWVKSESTGGHSISYGFPDAKVGTMGVTRDAEVEMIIQMFKGPILLSAPGSRGSGSSWSLG
jgi:hypothetical protein